MRRNRIVALMGAAALLVAACGDETPEQQGAEQRIAELEDELEEARQDNEELLAENERLAEELRLMTADEPDDDADTDDDAEDTGDTPDGTDDEDAGQEDATAGAADEPQPIRSAEGLNEQLRTLFDLGDGPDGEWEPGTTGWRSADPPPGLDDSYDTPGELALAVAAALDAPMLGMDSWETTTRVLMDDDDPDMAYVAVLSWGFADDAVAGRDLRMTITSSNGGWSPGGAEERYHCRRGVTDDDLCL